MKKLVREPRPAVPIFIKVDGQFNQVEPHHICGECFVIAGSKEFAEKCCKQYLCEDCGADTYQFWSRCHSCSERARLNKADEIEYDGGPVFTEQVGGGRDGYFDSIDDLIEFCEEDEVAFVPEFVYPCSVVKWSGLDVDWALENATEDFCEEAYENLNKVGELTDFVKEWNKKQYLSSLEADFKKKVRVPKQAIS